MTKIAIIYFSAQGHTEQLANAVAEGARNVADTEVTLYRVVGDDIVDGRWKNDAILDGLTASDAIIFGTPTYMGDTAGQFKCFIDGASGLWFKQAWKNKLAAAFTHSSSLSGDKLNTLQSLLTNAMQHSMIWIGTGELPGTPKPGNVNRLASSTGAMAQTWHDETQCDAGDLKTAKILGGRVATFAVKLT